MIDGSKVNVYIFGAGASKHLGAPLTKEFIPKGFSLLRFSEAYDVPEESFRMVAHLIDRLYGTGLEKYVEDARSRVREYYSIPAINIEDLLSFVDLGLRRCETWLPFENLQRALLEVIFTTLEELTRPYYGDTLRRCEDGTLEHQRNCYDKLVDYIMHVSEINCMISFNYDLFLDQAVSINNHKILGDYNIEFADVENFSGYERFLSKQRKKGDVDLLKLHGSLNWARCPQCQRLFLAYFREYREILRKSCTHCGNQQLLPVLIPPTLLKNIQISELVGVWNRAEYLVERMDSFIIIGYSFPEADIEAKWLFKRAIARNGSKPSLTLVEPDSSVRRRVVEFLGNFFQEDIIFFDTFEGYCEHMIQNK